MPWAGTSRSGATRILAVGKPSVPPRASPLTTIPSTSAARPRRCAARSTSPARSSPRISVDETPSTSGTLLASKPRRSTSSRSPARPWPKRKSAPATTTSAPIRRRNAFTNASGSSAASFAVNGTTRTSAMPASAISSSRRSRVVSSSTRLPSTTRGCGSNVTTVGVSPASTAARRIRWWPTWTPSKVPSATARGRASSSSGARATVTLRAPARAAGRARRRPG